MITSQNRITSRNGRIAAAVLLLAAMVALPAAGQIIVDHNCTKLPKVPASWIAQAKANLHIVYGHTSHGSQVTTGMAGLVGFTGGCGGPQFAWNNGGTNGALDLHDGGMAGDVGYYPQWVNETTKYLDNPANSNVNVVIWSWCGQHAGYTQQVMIDQYLKPMTSLETTYPQVKFVYMTGHVTYGSTVCVARNQQIRDYCRTNNKILFDFADIETFDPDGKHFPWVNDNCDYYDRPSGGTRLGNWATEWQARHVQDVHWYNCSSAHSQALNANLKAYAAWWLWARLAGWPGQTSLTRDLSYLSCATGGRVSFALDAGAANAGRAYLMTGSVSGTVPGFKVPGTATTVPLKLDPFSYLMVQLANTPNYQRFMGSLDAQGRATAALQLGKLPAAVAGHALHFAYLLYDAPLDFASDPISVKLVP